MGIRRERAGWRAYVRVDGKLVTKRFPADTPSAAMDAWMAGQRVARPASPSAEQIAFDFWEAYQPGWVVGLLKTPHGWKVQVSIGGCLKQKRFGRRTSLVEMLRWRDGKRPARPVADGAR